MTTKELENKLKISENTCIHCPTLGLAKQVLSIFHKLNLKWCNGIAYTKCTDWDNYKENTVYYPFKGAFSSLEFAQEEGYKIINAKKFIALHTEDEEFDLENYEPKGQLIGFPKEVIARMLECQVEQGNKRDISVFEERISTGYIYKGFDWHKTKEGCNFWFNVIKGKNFNVFFKIYPKKEDNQEFRVGDKVIDIISGLRGKIIDINTLNNSIFVDFDENEIAVFTLDGRDYSIDKYPRLLHYRDDYDYSVIDFNNLPKRQEQKMWRAKEGGVYYFVNFLTKGWFFSDESSDDYDCPIDNNNYNSGNYFRTEVEAEIIAQKLNTYFKQLIKEEHDIHRN
jgi:hypothetical protein